MHHSGRIGLSALLVWFSAYGTSKAQITDPRITHWVFNLDGHHGHSTVPTINATVSTILADVQSVQYTATDAYVRATGIPTYDVGPFGDGNPNLPTNQNRTFRITRSPQLQSGTKTNTPLGSIGAWVNGVAVFNAKDAHSYNNQGIWNQNAVVVEAAGFDAALGHPAPGGAYHHHQRPIALLAQLGDLPTVHSPLVGYAFDGFPIYGPYGYANTDGTGGITRIRSSYQLRNITTRTNGPAVSAQYPLGYYVEDFEYIAGLGDLDQYNGRTCVTPEFPGGIYAYFTTINADGSSAYPYAIGPQYYGVVISQTGVTVPGGATTYTPACSMPAPTIWTEPVPATICGNGSAIAIFSIALRYGGSALYQWRRNSVNVEADANHTGVTTATLTITGASVADAGQYDCIVTQACGNPTSDPATLTVLTIAADFTDDCVVDDSDFDIFKACATGPDVSYDPAVLPAGCTLTPYENGWLAADFDHDNDIDQSDYGILQRCYSDANQFADPACAD